MGKTTFEAVLERPEGVGTWTYLAVPFNAQEEYGAKGQIKVKGTIDGLAFHSTLLSRGDGTHFMVVTKPIRERLGVSSGSTVTVVMEADTGARKVPLPKDLAAALAARKTASAAFEKMAPSHQKQYVEWIESAVRADTRQRRIGKALEMIAANERLKG